MEEALLSKTDVPPTPERVAQIKIINNANFDLKRYEYDFSWKKGDTNNPHSVHSTVEMLECLDKNPHIELDARVQALTPQGVRTKKLGRQDFREAFMRGDKAEFKMKEGVDIYQISDGNGPGYPGGPLVGEDFMPLLGGPFYKNLYYYQDYIRMHTECFYAYHWDPLAKAFMAITRDFVMGTGFEVRCDTSDRKGQLAMALWKTFEEVNDYHQQMEDACLELGVYGETMKWWLPNHQTKIVYNLSPNNTIPVGLIPRVRVLDPSNMVEIVTYPEDITRKLFYVWLTPTQYQIYTNTMASDLSNAEPSQPTLKFIYQQIPAHQIMHYKVNAVSNEKRGRSDLFPILSYLKRIRDSVNYAIIADQKVAAWCMDTTIDGNQPDINNYVAAQEALGTIPPAGSEFVHTKAIKREYLGSSSASGTMSDAFMYAVSLCCAGVQIPINWLGTHLSGGSTRANAIVATEPVIKKFEKRREVMKRMIKSDWDRLMKESGLGLIACDVIFPEFITQDRSTKIQDIAFCEQAKYFKHERAASMVAKEMGVHDYDYNDEQAEIQKQEPLAIPNNPLSAGGKLPEPTQNTKGTTHMPQPPSFKKPAQGDEPSLALSPDERSEIKKNGREL